MSKKALLIGVNRYRIPGADLRGCVNDVNNLAKVLVDFYGFKKADIAVLTDEKATQAAMQKGIKTLVAGRPKGRRIAAALLGARCQRAGQERRRGRPARRDSLPARPRLEEAAARRLAAHDLRQAARRGEPDA